MPAAPAHGRVWLPLSVLGAHLIIVLVLFGRFTLPETFATWMTPGTQAAQRQDHIALVRRVREEPREVLGPSDDVVTLAPRPVLFEPDIYSIYFHQGLWDPTPLVERIARGEIGLLVLSRPLDDTSYWGPRPLTYWPEPVMAALREYMVLDTVQAGRWVDVPKRRSAAPTYLMRCGVHPCARRCRARALVRRPAPQSLHRASTHRGPGLPVRLAIRARRRWRRAESARGRRSPRKRYSRTYTSDFKVKALWRAILWGVCPLAQLRPSLSLLRRSLTRPPVVYAAGAARR